MRRTVLSLHLEENCLQVALISSRGKFFEQHFTRTFNRGQELKDVKLFDILAPLLPKKKFSILSGLETWQLLYRQLSLKGASVWTLQKMLPFQLEALLPYPLEDAQVLTFSRKFSKKEAEVNIFSVKNLYLDCHLQALAAYGIDPDIVTSIPHALLGVANYFFPKEKNLVIYHLGLRKSSYLLIQDGQLKICQAHHWGLNDFLEAYEKDSAHLPWSDLNLSQNVQDKHPHLNIALEKFKQESFRVSSFLVKKLGGNSSSAFLVCGCLHSNSFLKKFINESFSPTFTPVSPNPNFVEESAITLGLALDFFYSSKKAQFRQGFFTSPIHAAQLRKFKKAYLAACTILCTLLCSFGIFIHQKKENYLSHLLDHYISLEKWPSSISFEGTLSQRVDEWEEMIAELKKPLPLALRVPSVSDVLAWLSSHPFLSATKMIEVTKVNYKLVKYPKIGESSEAYQAKVELELTASSEQAAEQFHQELLKDPTVINTHKGIIWTPHSQNIHVQFWLKFKEVK